MSTRSLTSLVLGVLAFGFLWLVTRKATARRAVEDAGVRRARRRLRQRPGQGHLPRRRASSSRRSRSRCSCWVLLMNAMDFLPVDIMSLGLRARLRHQHDWRSVPTADVNTTFALALSVFALMIFYSIKVKGLGGWIHELFCAPFGSQSAAVAVQLAVQRSSNTCRSRCRTRCGCSATCTPARSSSCCSACGRRPASSARSFGGAAASRLVDLPHPDRRAAGLHLHDAHHRLHLDGARAPLIRSLTFVQRSQTRIRKESKWTSCN